MTHKYNVAVHAIFRNETKWLREWIEYHLMIGVEHFYLFCDDEEQEASKVEDILEDTFRDKCTYHCLYTHEESWLKRDKDFQIRPIKYVLKNYADEIKWLIVLDLDEFIFNRQDTETLYNLLQWYERPEIFGLHIPVSTFGTSGLLHSPELQTESFIMRGSDTCFANRTAKNFYLVDKIKDVFDGKIEAVMYDTDYNISPKGKHIRPSDILRVNHYATRSLEDWQAKIKRGNPFVKSQQEWDLKFQRYNKNDIKDTGMFNYLPELKRRLNGPS